MDPNESIERLARQAGINDPDILEVAREVDKWVTDSNLSYSDGSNYSSGSSSSSSSSDEGGCGCVIVIAIIVIIGAVLYYFGVFGKDDPSTVAAQCNAAGSGVICTIDADKSWQQIDLPLAAGDYIVIRYESGAWRVAEGAGTDCGNIECQDRLILDSPSALMIGRIGDTVPFIVRDQTYITVEAEGKLALRVNDKTDLDQNEGSLQFFIGHTDPNSAPVVEVHPTQPVAAPNPTSVDTPIVYHYVLAQELTFRSGPGVNYEALGTITQGSPVQVIGQATTFDGYLWYQIKTAQAREGWVYSEYISPTKP